METYIGVQMELVNVERPKPGGVEIYEVKNPALSGRLLFSNAAVQTDD